MIQQSGDTAVPSKRILVIARRTLGGVQVFWENLSRDQPRVNVLHYAYGDTTGFDPEENVFLINRFDSLTRVYGLLKARLDSIGYDLLVANEGFELGFFAWLAPVKPVCFIVHVNHQHSYDAAIRYSTWVDHFHCVSETGAVYLRARGLAPVTPFRYSTFIPEIPEVQKQRKVVYVGRFDPDKNIEETIDLLTFLKKKGYQVAMIGGGPLEAKVRDALCDSEVLVGASRARIFKELSEASFLCHNSYVEGLPIIHTEAIHFRLGIVCNYVDKSIHEVVGKNALLWSDREELVRSMESFTFTPPPRLPRVNSPELNEAFLDVLAATPLLRRDRRSTPPPGLLDRLPNALAPLVRSLREWRWNRR